MSAATAPRKFATALAAAALGCAAVAVPARSAAASAKASKQAPLVVNACVEGGVLTRVTAAGDDTSGRVFAPKYRLTGSRALVKEIKRDHAGHLDEFTGTASGDAASMGLGPSVKVGGVSVRMGGASPYDHSDVPRVPETPVFEVLSFRHTGENCRE